MSTKEKSTLAVLFQERKGGKIKREEDFLNNGNQSSFETFFFLVLVHILHFAN
jgi:hypothetical protein